MSDTGEDFDKQLEDIARKHLGISTLARRNSDRLDFHDVSVWGLKAALAEAVELGRSLEQKDEAKAQWNWRRLALQFDGHRMQALGHLKSMVQDAAKHRELAEKFLSAPPLSGEKVLAERIQAIAKAESTPASA